MKVGRREWSVLTQWVALLARFVSWQLATQVVMFGAAILAIRLLSVESFAEYSVAIAMQGMAVVLADLGVTSGASALAGRHSDDRATLRSVLATALGFRARLLAPSLAVALPVLWITERKAGAPWDHIAVYSATLIVAVHAQVLVGVFSVAPKILLKPEALQATTFAAMCVRLVLIGGSLALLPDGRVAASASAAGIWVQAVMVRALARKQMGGAEQQPRPEFETHFLRNLRSQLLTGIYFAFEPQITVVLLGWFGGARPLAENGALGRFGAVFVAISAVVGSIVAPRFARVKEPALLARRYAQVIAAAATVAAALFAGAALFHHQLLWVVGPKYSHLDRELVLMVASAGTYMVISTMSALNLSRSWVEGSWVYVPMTVALQAGLVSVMDLSTVHGAILFGWYTQVSPLAASLYLAWRGCRRERRGEHPTGAASVTEMAGSGTS